MNTSDESVVPLVGTPSAAHQPTEYPAQSP